MAVDVKKAKAAIDEAHKAINDITDAVVKAKQYNVLNALGFAAKGLELASTHLDKVVERSTPKPKVTSKK